MAWITRTHLPLWALVVFVATLIGYPLMWLVLGSGVTVDSALEYLSSPRVAGLVARSVLLAVGTTFVSCAVGTTIAFLVARTDLPFKGTVSVLVLASYMSPAFLLAFAYVMLLGPRAGVVNQLIASMTGVEGWLNIYSSWGFIALTSFEAVPIVFLMVAGTFASMHRPLEDGARILGAPRWRTMVTVTLPLAAPSIGAAALLVFVHTISLYGVPAVLNIPVVTTEIQASFTWPPKFDRAAALSLALVLISLIVVYAYRRLTAGQERYATVSGRWVAPEELQLGAWRSPVLYAVIAYLSLATILPYLTLLFASLSVSWTAGLGLENFTVAHYREVFADQYNVRAITNSVLLAVGAASAGVLLGVVLSYVDVRATGFRGRGILDYIASLPWGIPSIALGAGLILAFIRPPVLYGTLWILLLSYLIKFLPLAVRASNAALRQVTRDLEQASRITGATGLQTLRRITVPLIKNGLVAGWLLIFFPSLRELSSSIILVSPNNETLAVAALSAWESVNFENATALAVVTLLVSVVPWLVFPGLRRGTFRLIEHRKEQSA